MTTFHLTFQLNQSAFYPLNSLKWIKCTHHGHSQIWNHAPDDMFKPRLSWESARNITYDVWIPNVNITICHIPFCTPLHPPEPPCWLGCCWQPSPIACQEGATQNRHRCGVPIDLLDSNEDWKGHCEKTNMMVLQSVAKKISLSHYCIHSIQNEFYSFKYTINIKKLIDPL